MYVNTYRIPILCVHVYRYTDQCYHFVQIRLSPRSTDLSCRGYSVAYQTRAYPYQSHFWVDNLRCEYTRVNISTIFYIVWRLSEGFCSEAVLLNERMRLACHGSVYTKASGAYNGCDRSDNLVLPNSGCKCNHTQCVFRPN